MGVTYTPNLHLGLQEDKRDYLNWDLIVANWKKLDSAIGTGVVNFDSTMPRLIDSQTQGYQENVEQEG